MLFRNSVLFNTLLLNALLISKVGLKLIRSFYAFIKKKHFN